MVASAILGAVITAFALVNLDEVEVNWLIGSADTPLIIVIALSFVLGVVADRLFAARSRRRESRRRS